ncbi:hypothetical protein EC957_007155 [Mortierella hygrophila]|uniref:Uncharacterized protein n=1 Tax=Mortierella hygrophila TaxID=979708 RepID=A0A9P6FD94_9FUNG|nr:hypothetical protein EC957_007155 [Mortierella hygrophila]
MAWPTTLGILHPQKSQGDVTRVVHAVSRFESVQMLHNRVQYNQYAQAIQVLSTTSDAQGNTLRITDLPEPTPFKTRRILLEEVGTFEEVGVETCEKDGSGGINTYMNFLMVNGGVATPEFGDVEADAEAKKIMEE